MSTTLARQSPASASASLAPRFSTPGTPGRQIGVASKPAAAPVSAPGLTQVSAPTPTSASSSAPAQVASTPQPGTWRHPSLDVIARRQSASVFNGDNINQIVFNALCLLATVYAPNYAYPSTPSAIVNLLGASQPYTTYFVLLMRVYFAFKIAVACTPLFRTKDEIEDIPLTPSQRALLGLKPSSAPLTPGQHYITPPRYARSSTPRSSTRTSGSPLSARTATPSSVDPISFGQSKATSGSPYSSSPLMQKALGGASAARRLSYSSSPLDIGSMNGGGVLPSTPTTGLASGKASVGLNSKWLYERGRSSPNGKALFT